jgi:Tol biopolymer transport system component
MARMRAPRRVFVAGILALALGAGRSAALRETNTPLQGLPAGSPGPAARWDRAVEAWDSGRYPDALGDLLALLEGPAASDYHARIALLTGELFASTEITTDGRNPRLSTGGRYATYEIGFGPDATTRIVRLGDSVTPIADVRGSGLVFDAAGARAAWVQPAAGASSATAIVVRDLASGEERVWLSDALAKSSLAWSGDGRRLFFLGADAADKTRSDVYTVGESGGAVQLTTGPGLKARPLVDPQGSTIVYVLGSSGGRGRGAGAGGTTAVIEHPETKTTRTLTGIAGTALTMSADGSTIAWIASTAGGATVLRRMPAAGGSVEDLRTAAAGQRMDAPALSPDGRLAAYQFMASAGARTDWDIHVTDAAGAHRRITDDIQHDVLPRFLTNDRLLGLMGEPRHRRSYVYDLTTGERRRVFANNTIRTISPEYAWAPSPDGAALAVEADRDGDTVSPAHGISVLDLSREVTRAGLRARLDAQRAAETDLRQRMAQAFRPIVDLAARVVSSMTPTRVYRHEQALSAFGSKHISQPGNARAMDYLERAYRSFGYAPELQWLPATGRGTNPARRSANVVATLKGTVHPELIYVVSSHFDSVAAGPGADDNTSGTAALLEAARALATAPLPATVVFASFTGEESGLLGSREFVRLAAERQWRIVGALNNDMIGWSGEGGRMDNTIRYSNPGIRDIQHGAALLFSNLVLYDAKYYRGTDAAAFYEAWGDIVGGIGSHPVLGNPNYHQSTDLLETINFAQVAETAKVTAASIVYLASSPSRLADVRVARTPRGGVQVTWSPSPERDVESYVVTYRAPDNSTQRRLTVRAPRATLPALPPGTSIAVKAVNRRSLEGWDWARGTVP